MNVSVKDAQLLFDSNKLLKAKILIRKLLRKNSSNTLAILLKVKLAEKEGLNQEALNLLQTNLIHDNEESILSEYLFKKMITEEKYEWIIKNYKKLNSIQKQSIEIILCLGYANERVGRFKLAITSYKQVILKSPKNERAYMALGHALRYQGEQSLCIEQYRKCIELNSELTPNAYWSISNLKDSNFAVEDLTNMKSLIENPNIEEMKKSYLGFALGKAYEELCEYKTSLDYYTLANECNPQGKLFDALKHREYMKSISKNFGKKIQVLSDDKLESPKPIFILGMPRSGSTLIEQILSSHSEVERVGELPYINRILWDIDSSYKNEMYPNMIEKISENKLIEYRNYYLKSVESHRKLKKSYFIDKNPNNFENIGVIKMLFPNAVIIDSRREFYSNAFSLFKQLFIRGQEYSYSKATIQSYYSDYIFLMKFWNKRFLGQIIKVEYNSLVTNFESSVRNLLEKCNLDFEYSCIEFYKNKQAVDTASSEQVRKPIFTKAIDAWRNYEEYFKSLEIEEINY